MIISKMITLHKTEEADMYNYMQNMVLSSAGKHGEWNMVKDDGTYAYFLQKLNVRADSQKKHAS